MSQEPDPERDSVSIVDAHAHIGVDFVLDEAYDEDGLPAANRAAGVHRSIVQQLICRPYLEDTMAAHDAVVALCASGRGKFWGTASMNPHFRPERVEAELSRCVKRLGFVGIKITHIGHAAHPSGADAMKGYEMAHSLGVPVMVHTGHGAWKRQGGDPEVRIRTGHVWIRHERELDARARDLREHSRGRCIAQAGIHEDSGGSLAA